MMTTDRVLLAYSGDVVSSCALAWLLEHEHEVATITVDLGQGRDLNDVRDRALGIGATRAHVVDLRDQFAAEAVVPACRRPLTYPQVALLARPFVARQLVDVARIEGTAVVAHGAEGPASDAASLDAALRIMAPGLTVMAPARDWEFDWPALLAYGRSHGVPIPAVADQCSEARTLWGRAVTAASLDAAEHEPPSHFYLLTRSLEASLREPSSLAVTFAGGRPSALNGVPMSLVDLMTSLETIAGAHGIGRLDFPAVPGVRPRILEEAPAAVVLNRAYEALADAKDGTIHLVCATGSCTVTRKELA